MGVRVSQYRLLLFSTPSPDAALHRAQVQWAERANITSGVSSSNGSSSNLSSSDGGGGTLLDVLLEQLPAPEERNLTLASMAVEPVQVGAQPQAQERHGATLSGVDSVLAVPRLLVVLARNAFGESLEAASAVVDVPSPLRELTGEVLRPLWGEGGVASSNGHTVGVALSLYPPVSENGATVQRCWASWQPKLKRPDLVVGSLWSPSPASPNPVLTLCSPSRLALQPPALLPMLTSCCLHPHPGMTAATAACTAAVTPLPVRFSVNACRGSGGATATAVRRVAGATRSVGRAPTAAAAVGTAPVRWRAFVSASWGLTVPTATAVRSNTTATRRTAAFATLHPPAPGTAPAPLAAAVRANSSSSDPAVPSSVTPPPGALAMACVTLLRTAGGVVARRGGRGSAALFVRAQYWSCSR